MDLPINFPPGTRFWQLIIDAVADLTTGEFLLLDGSLVAGDQAARLRRRIEGDGVEISEAAFRELAPPSLAERLQVISDRAARDSEFAKALGALADEDRDFKECERIAWDAFRSADPDDQREGARLLLKIAAKKQKVSDQ